ncbi:unnamed protein product [Hymenolepis diminuta]|uniref:Uncharacterized protein n=1 Tax=Hymenolepis diminuta TaxID=6216 RepID=A0A564YLM4_HYMDI|nr:unnamed protein product [Hymenolepis diminuta]
MGVPKFYRWISQRYPCINQIIKENEVVPIDHLYLDLNGIIHSSSHCDGLAFNVFDEDKVFQTIANYISHIINLIKPRKTIFLAVDGVAPRAKMTQQRARRFVGPKKVADEVKKRKQKGQKIDEMSLFDSNVISPGTEFMVRLHEFFKSYIANQITNDSTWRRVDIIYSGHDAPGEGEQKIREYMSYKRSLSDYLPNERHCLYGMDADLIFLGLATHEPNLCILRENVYTVTSPVPQDIPFCLVHLSLLREYIGLEFKDLKGEISFHFDLERIIDDWIFMGYLLGNDFVPNLPNMHIHAESFIFLWDTYHVVLPKLDGYINEFGKLNLRRFHLFITELASFDTRWFAESQADQRWMHGKHGAKMARELQCLGKKEAISPSNPSLEPLDIQHKAPIATSEQKEESIVAFFGGDDSAVIPLDSAESVDEKLTALMANVNMDRPIPSEVVSLEEIEPNLSDEEDVESGDLSASTSAENEREDLSDREWFDSYRSLNPPVSLNVTDSMDSEEDEDTISYRMHRQDYYYQKLKINIRGNSKRPDESFVEAALLPICREYVKALQWVLDYYFNSVVDWKHYYPYHYAPFVSDLPFFTKRFLKDGPDYEKRDDWAGFELNTKPLLPFEQQMFIMPTASSKILPQPYRCLFAEGSPVAEFFPNEFQTDINGKLADWEAVVLIPFIDEAKMLAAMAPLTRFLSPEDAKRNIHRGHQLLMAKNREKFNFSDKPTFEDLLTEEVDGEFYRSHVLSDPEQCLKVYCQLPRRVHPAYPSLYRILFTPTIERVGVTTFSCPSKGQSILLTVSHPLGRSKDIGPAPLREVAKTFLGHPVYTGWPYSRLVLPVLVLDEKEIWEVDISRGKTRIIDRTNLRQQPDSPLWSSVKWLRSQSDWCVLCLRDRCAIKLAGGQPRAALLCLPVADVVFSISVSSSDPSYVNVRPMCLNTQNLTKKICETRNQHHYSHRSKGPQVNKQSLRHDSNVSIAISSEATLEILDLTMGPSPTAAFDRALFDVFSRAAKVFIFDRPKSKHFGRLGEIVNTTVDNNLTVKLLPKILLPKDPTGVLEMAIEADDTCYMTVQQMSRELHLTQHVIQRLVGDFMVRIPLPSPDDHNPASRKVTSRPTDDRRNFANLGFNLRLHNDRAFVVGWSHFSTIQRCWKYSRRTMEALAKYYQLFPDLVNFIGSFDMHKPPPEMSAIYPQNTFLTYTQIRNFLRTEVKGNRTVTVVGAPLLGTAGLSLIENCLLPVPPAQLTSSSKSAHIVVAPTDVFVLLPEGGRIVSKAYQTWLRTSNRTLDKFTVLDRIVYVGPRDEMFGLGGFVIGAYPILGKETIEVMFDRTFEGAVSIRGSSPRCMVVPAAHLLHYPRCTGISKTNSDIITVNKSSLNEKSKYGNKSSASKHSESLYKQKRESTRTVKHLVKEKEMSSHVVEKPSAKKRPPPVKDILNAEPVRPSDDLLPAEWLQAPPIEFATETVAPLVTAVPAKSKAPKSVKPTLQAPHHSPHTDGGVNAIISPHIKQSTPIAEKMRTHVPPSNRQETQQQGNQHHPKPNATNAQFNPQSSPLMYLTSSNLGSPTAPNMLPPPDWQMGGQSTMANGGLLEFCLPSPYQSQFMPVRPLSLGLEPFWAANGSIVFVDQTTKTFYTPEQVNEIFSCMSSSIPLQQPQLLSSMDSTFQYPMPQLPTFPPQSQMSLGFFSNEVVPSMQLSFDQSAIPEPLASTYFVPDQVSLFSKRASQ